MSADETGRKTASYWILAVSFFIVLLDFYFFELNFVEFNFLYKISADYKRIFSNEARYVLRGLFVLYFFIVTYTEFNVKIKIKKIDESFTWKLVIGVSSGLFTCLFIFHPFDTWYTYIIWLIAVILLVPQLKSILKKDFDIKNDSDLLAEKEPDYSDNSFTYETPDGRYVNVRNPFQGVLVSGGAGSGKSASFAEPTIYQMSKKGFTGILYDFKNFELTKILFKSYTLNECPVSLYVINFTELDKSHRVNPIQPDNIPHIAFVDEYVNALLNNINKTWITKEGDFWVDSAKSILKATIWYFKRNHPEFCTIPHAVNTILNFGTAELAFMLSSDTHTRGMISSLAEAFENESMDQVSGATGTIKNALQKINTPQIAWVLSGSDLNLDLNDPKEPKMLCLNNYPPTIDSISPVISLIITVAMKRMNVAKKEKSIILLDEAPTLYIPKLDQIPATARSNRVCVYYMQQDFSQLEQTYGKVPMNAIIGNLGNQFLGKASGKQTLDYVSSIVGKEDRYIKNYSSGESQSESSGSSSENYSYNNQERLIIKPQDVMSFKPGEFICSVTKGEKPFFRTSTKMLADYSDYKGGNDVQMEVPSFSSYGKNEDGSPRFVDNEIVAENFEKIQNEVKELEEYYNKIMKEQKKEEQESIIEKTETNDFVDTGNSDFADNLLDD